MLQEIFENYRISSNKKIQIIHFTALERANLSTKKKRLLQTINANRYHIIGAGINKNSYIE